MTIDLILPRRRHQVAWFRDNPPRKGCVAFLEREFRVSPTACSVQDLQQHAFLSALAAVVFTQNPAKPLQITRDLQAYAPMLLDYDCRVIVRHAPSAGDKFAQLLASVRLPMSGLPVEAGGRIEERDPPLPHVRVFGPIVPWRRVANFVAENPAGYAPSYDLNIPPIVDEVVDGEGIRQLSADHERLLRRAFWDCAEVHLVPMDDGRSGVSVYRAYSELAEGQLGRWPLPHFVKMGNRAKIFDEYQNYETRVDPYVPFHLGPHLVRERCCLGARHGIIVGDYVEESESLRDCARRGRAASAIACLFDRTLFGWHRFAQRKPSSIADELKHVFPRKIASNRFARAQELGARKTIAELRTLFDLCTESPVLIGPIHGDLHAANVRVRATDAIVIDFVGHREFPLVYDAACLEASLLVEGFADDRRDCKEWLQSLEPLYDFLLDGTLPHINPKNASFWFHACARQIRRYARQWECSSHQYAAALAVALLFKASKDSGARESEACRRAAAYVLAERILTKAFYTPPPAEEPKEKSP